MRGISVILAAGTLAAAGPDSSWYREPIDPSKFTLLRAPGPWEGTWTTAPVSPLGTLLAYHRGHRVVLIDMNNGTEVRSLDGHTADLHDSAWSRDGRSLVSTGSDATVRVWNVCTGRQILSLSPHEGYA